MVEATEAPTADEAALLDEYLRERLLPHPILNRFLAGSAVCAMGSSIGFWDERSDLDLRFLLPAADHGELTHSLRRAHLWDPARDCRVRLVDREPFRRFPGARLAFVSPPELDRQLKFDLPTGLWSFAHAHTLQDPGGLLEGAIARARALFHDRLPALRCEHYYRFRAARNEMAAAVQPGRPSTLLAIKRGEAVAEALRLAFLADGKPFPPDTWLESMAERETACGSSIVTAVRGLLVAREADAVDHAGKVLRDRVIFALQQGGVSEPWLEQWWMWASSVEC